MRVLGFLGGLLAGLGTSVLLVLYAVLPASSWVVLVPPIVGAIAGLAVAWPRRVAFTDG